MRVWSILLRTLHLLSIGILVGGHAFNAPIAPLRPMLYLAIVSGVGMAFIEACPCWQALFQGWGILVMTKLALLCAVPFAWSHRFAILVVVLAIASVGSHMTKRLRHWAPFFGPEANSYSKTRVGVSRKQFIQVDANLRERRPRMHRL
jgi:hypothetical protein